MGGFNAKDMILTNLNRLGELLTDQAQERREAMANALNDANARLGELTGHDSDVNTLPREIERLSDDLVATDARAMALDREIHRMASQAAAHVDNDPMARELGEIVSLQEATYKQAQESKDPAVVTASRMKLAEARLALAQRKEALTSGQAGGQLAKFSNMLAELSVERTVLQEKIRAAKDKRAIRREELSKLRAEIAGRNKEFEETKGFRIEKVTRKTESLPFPAPGDRPLPGNRPDRQAPPTMPAEVPGGQ